VQRFDRFGCAAQLLQRGTDARLRIGLAGAIPDRVKLVVRVTIGLQRQR
jgi:hypothetical protein